MFLVLFSSFIHRDLPLWHCLCWRERGLVRREKGESTGDWEDGDHQTIDILDNRQCEMMYTGELKDRESTIRKIGGLETLRMKHNFEHNFDMRPLQ